MTPAHRYLALCIFAIVVAALISLAIGEVMKRLDWVWGRFPVMMILSCVLGALAGKIVLNYFP